MPTAESKLCSQDLEPIAQTLMAAVRHDFCDLCFNPFEKYQIGFKRDQYWNSSLYSDNDCKRLYRLQGLLRQLPPAYKLPVHSFHLVIKHHSHMVSTVLLLDSRRL